MISEISIREVWSFYCFYSGSQDYPTKMLGFHGFSASFLDFLPLGRVTHLGLVPAGDPEGPPAKGRRKVRLDGGFRWMDADCTVVPSGYLT